MLNVLWNFVAFIITIGILITVHEFGHFWVARRCGVHVDRFSIGFGKFLWRYTDRHGTEFVIALIPLGGYVKMLNEHVKNIESKERHDAFNNKTVEQRATIVIAGLVANFIFAIFIYWLVFIIGVPSIRPVIEEVVDNSVAAHAKIIPGMEIRAIDGVKTPDWNTVRLQLISKIGNAHTSIIVSSFNSNQLQEKVLNLQHWSFEPYKEDPILALGIYPHNAQIEMILAEVEDNCAARKAGLQAGDRIVKVNGQLLTKWMTFVNLIRNNLDESINLEIDRQGKLFFLTLIPDKNFKVGKAEKIAGMAPKVTPLLDDYKTIRKYGPFVAIFEAVGKTWQLIKLTINMLGKLITGNVKINSLSGPISIAQGAGMSAEFGIIYYLMFLAFVSVNLGVINLLPLPVLDGGHLIFLVIEKLKGTPLSKQIQEISYRIGFILMILLIGIALLNDFSRL